MQKSGLSKHNFTISLVYLIYFLYLCSRKGVWRGYKTEL